MWGNNYQLYKLIIKTSFVGLIPSWVCHNNVITLCLDFLYDLFCYGIIIFNFLSFLFFNIFSSHGVPSPCLSNCWTFLFLFCVNFFQLLRFPLRNSYSFNMVSSTASQVCGNQLSEIIQLYWYCLPWNSLIYFSCVIYDLSDPECVSCGVQFAQDNWLRVFIQSFVDFDKLD